MRKASKVLSILIIFYSTFSLAQTKCVNFKEYEDLKTLKEKANWLKSNSENVCEGKQFLFEKIYSSHEITASNFKNRMINSPNKTGTIYTWKQINQLTSNYKDYEKYIAFDLNNGKINIKLIDQFDASNFCYSIALFRCIYNRNSIKFDTDELVFEFFIDNNSIIIFNVLDFKAKTNLSNHNISDIPLLEINDKYLKKFKNINKLNKFVNPF